MRSVCVFCGSNRGHAPEFARAADELGTLLANQQLTLIYGGGGVGLMRVVADAALNAGGHVVGVIPHALATKELEHPGVREMHRVDTMHERKARMADLADGFIALPGGFGTLDELAEIVTWAQLGIHRKPCAVLNVMGYFDALLSFLDHAVAAGLARREHRDLMLVDSSPGELLVRMRGYRSPVERRWVSSGQR